MRGKLDNEEQEILHAVENRQHAPISKTTLAKYTAIAKATMKKNARVNIRISQKDITEIKLRAAEEHIPYQTLIASIIHKYNTGRLVDKKIG